MGSGAQDITSPWIEALHVSSPLSLSVFGLRDAHQRSSCSARRLGRSRSSPNHGRDDVVTAEEHDPACLQAVRSTYMEYQGQLIVLDWPACIHARHMPGWQAGSDPSYGSFHYSPGVVRSQSAQLRAERLSGAHRGSHGHLTTWTRTENDEGSGGNAFSSLKNRSAFDIHTDDHPPWLGLASRLI